MIVDSSVWIDFARRATTDQVDELKHAVREGRAMTTDAVRMEVLAGQTDVELLSAGLDGCVDLLQEPRTDVEAAAAIYRRCRRAGEKISSLNDCLIAAIAIRHDVPVLHRDRDYDVIARHTSLRVSRG